MESKTSSGYPQLPSAPNMEPSHAAPPSYAQATGANMSTYPSSPPPTSYQSLPVQQQAPIAKYPQQQLPPGGVQVVQRIVVQAAVGPHSSNVLCPSCQMQVKSRVSHDTTTRTHLMALICCLVCCPCTCVPYCMDSCKDTNHYCPNCNAFIGTYRDRL